MPSAEGQGLGARWAESSGSGYGGPRKEAEVPDATPPNDLPTRVAVLEEIAHWLKAAIERIDRRFDSVDRRFDSIDRRLETMERNQRSDFRWLLGIMIGGYMSLLGRYASPPRRHGARLPLALMR